MLTSIFLPFLAPLAPTDFLYRAHSMGEASVQALFPRHSRGAVSGHSAGLIQTDDTAARDLYAGAGALYALLAILCLGVVVFLVRLGRDYLRLRRLACEGWELRKIGKIRVVVSPAISTPFSARLPGLALVALPESILDSVGDYRLAIRHEIQHHRAGDTLWVYAFELLRAAFFWNPFCYGLIVQIGHIQEFACDETLIGHQRVLPQAYGGCLVRAAEIAVRSRPLFAGTTGMAASSSGKFLSRRIEMIMSKKKCSGRAQALATRLGWFVSMAMMASVALVAQAMVPDHRLTVNEAALLAAKDAGSGQFPVSVNEQVVRELNRYIGTPEGRQYVRDGLARMPAYREMIDGRLKEYGLPPELVVIPLAEGGYRNVTWKPGAGLWGFIESTARRYGLIINDDADERLDPPKETEAAAKYFSHLHHLFGDYRLAAQAYNEGESHVQALIDELGTRDPWSIEAQAGSRERYLSKVTALIIIMRNPSLVQ